MILFFVYDMKNERIDKKFISAYSFEDKKPERHITDLKGLPTGINAACLDHDRSPLFFKSNFIYKYSRTDFEDVSSLIVNLIVI